MAEGDDKTPKTPLTPEQEFANYKPKMTPTQWFTNYIGLGYVGNTVVAVATVNFFKKATPKLYDKMVGHYEKKFIKRQEAKLLDPIADKLDDAAKATLKEHIQKEAHHLAEKTLDTRLLSVGGFAMAPLQSAMEVKDFDSARRSFAIEKDLDPDAVVGEKPKFNPLGPEAGKNMPKWMIGRTVALGAAYGAQNIVDGKFGKQKDAMDNAIAKIITRVVKRGKPIEADGSALGDEAAAAQAADKGIDPKILKNVRVVTSDAYMTAVAIATSNFSNKHWATATGKLGDAAGKLGIDGIREKLMGGGQGKGA